MTIDQTVIDQAKGTDLVALARAKGIELKKNGKSYFGLCPFHADKNPSLSINPSKNLFQCFGCGVAGDAIRFVELLDQVSFPEAVKRLSGEAGHLPPPPQKPPQRNPLTAKAQKLLARVVGHYQHTLGADGRGLNYLKQERGIADNQSIKDFGAGYANGTLLELLPDDPDVLKRVEHLMGIADALRTTCDHRRLILALLSFAREQVTAKYVQMANCLGQAVQRVGVVDRLDAGGGEFYRSDLALFERIAGLGHPPVHHLPDMRRMGPAVDPCIDTLLFHMLRQPECVITQDLCIADLKINRRGAVE